VNDSEPLPGTDHNTNDKILPVPKSPARDSPQTIETKREKPVHSPVPKRNVSGSVVEKVSFNYHDS
jgi:hypothetical protein